MTLRYDPSTEPGPTHGTNGNGTMTRDQLEDRANRVLSELLRRLDVLDERRQNLKSAGGLVKYEIKRHLPLSLAVGAGAIAVGVLVLRGMQARREREFRRQLMGRVIGRLLGDGAPEPPRSGFLRRTLRSTGLRLLLFAGSELGRRALHRTLEGQR